MPAPDGANTLLEAVGRLAAANIAVADIALRRPSLDDVFLALTDDSPQPRTPVAEVRQVTAPSTARSNPSMRTQWWVLTAPLHRTHPAQR